MSTNYILKNHVAIINRGRDEEFDVTCDVSFSVTPREAATSTYPGAEPGIEDIVVTLHGDQLLYPIPEAIQMVEAMIEDELAEDDIALWAHVTRQRERELL
jgi:hypothetical protein